MMQYMSKNQPARALAPAPILEPPPLTVLAPPPTFPSFPANNGCAPFGAPPSFGAPGQFVAPTPFIAPTFPVAPVAAPAVPAAVEPTGKGKRGAWGDDPKKIFVGGLPKETTYAEVRRYFEEFGKIKDLNLKVEKADGSCRGFGWVTFEDQSVADYLKIYKANCQFKDVWIIVKSGNGEEESARLFLGGLHKDCTPGMVHDHFSQFCKVTAVDLKYDMQGDFRKFGFVSVENRGVAEMICAMEHKILDKVVDVKASWDKGENAAASMLTGAGNPLLAAIAAQAATNPLMAAIAQQAAAKVQATFAGIAAVQHAALDPVALAAAQAAQASQGQQVLTLPGNSQAAPDLSALVAMMQATQANNAAANNAAAGRSSPY